MRRGAGTFIEVSAHPALTMPLADLAAGQDGDDEPAVMVASLRRDEPPADHLSAAISTAAVADPAYRWSDLVPAPAGPPPRGFPNAPMRSTHFWIRPKRTERQPQPESDAHPQVAREVWRPRAATTEPPSRTVAVVTAPGADESVAQRLRAAIARHPRARTADADVAEVLAVIAPAHTESNAAKAANDLGLLVDSGLLEFAGEHHGQVQWLITAGAERAQPTDPPAAPLQAAVAAIHRCTGFEHPETVFAGGLSPTTLSIRRWAPCSASRPTWRCARHSATSGH
jgi:mycobactin polyketide synthetase MbtD